MPIKLRKMKIIIKMKFYYYLKGLNCIYSATWHYISETLKSLTFLTLSSFLKIYHKKTMLIAGKDIYVSLFILTLLTIAKCDEHINFL